MEPVVVGLVTLIVLLPMFAFWVWMFNDMNNNSMLTDEARRYWLMVFVVGTVLGAVWYYFNEYRR